MSCCACITTLSFLLWLEMSNALKAKNCDKSIFKDCAPRPSATLSVRIPLRYARRSSGEVDAFHAKALALGGADEGATGYRAPKEFYFSYFRDLDGNKLCVYCMA